MTSINNTTSYKLDKVKIEKIIESFLKKYRKGSFEVSVAVVGSKRMRTLNKRFRGIDKPTDVLSFPAGSDNPQSTSLLGEIVINIDEIKKLSKYTKMFSEIGRQFPKGRNLRQRESEKRYLFYFLLTHGLFHLVGYDDYKDKDRLNMLRLGRDFLDKML